MPHEEAFGALDSARRSEAGRGEVDCGTEGRDREGRGQATEAEAPSKEKRERLIQYLLDLRYVDPDSDYSRDEENKAISDANEQADDILAILRGAPLPDYHEL